MASIYGSVLAVFFPLKLKRSFLQSTACSSDGLYQKLAFLLQVVKNVSFDTDALTQLVMITVKQVSSQSDRVCMRSAVGLGWCGICCGGELSITVKLSIYWSGYVCTRTCGPELWVVTERLRLKEWLGSSLARGWAARLFVRDLE